jgi:hypothetical protein
VKIGAAGVDKNVAVFTDCGIVNKLNCVHNLFLCFR